MKVYETRLDDGDAANLLRDVCRKTEPSSARLVGMAPALEDADEETFHRLVDVDREYVDVELELDGEASVDDVAALISGAMRVVVASDDTPLYVRYDDGTTFFAAEPSVAEPFDAEEARGADDRGVVREMQADAEADEALEDR